MASLIAIYADESCLGNGREGENPGGAGGLMELAHPRSGAVVRRDYWLSEAATTNNRMALRSAIEALRVLSTRGDGYDIVFTSDSLYLVKGMREWVYGWMERGWRRKGGALENVALWQELAEAARAHRIEWRWVRGHDGHPQNEYANWLATRAAERQDRSDGAVASEFERWLERERTARRITLEPDAIPSARTFRPSPPLPRPTTGSLF